MRAYLLMALAALGLPAVAQAADSDSDPCTIALCLANPNGPTAVAECEPPIRYLMKRLAQGKSMPKCDMGGGGSAEKQGDHVVFNMPGQGTTYFNWKTGKSVKVPEGYYFKDGRVFPLPPKGGSGSGNKTGGGNVREQLK